LLFVTVCEDRHQLAGTVDTRLLVSAVLTHSRWRRNVLSSMSRLKWRSCRWCRMLVERCLPSFDWWTVAHLKTAQTRNVLLFVCFCSQTVFTVYCGKLDDYTRNNCQTCSSDRITL